MGNRIMQLFIPNAGLIAMSRIYHHIIRQRK